MNCLEQLGKRILYWDGGMGSLLQERGLKGGELPEIWNVTHREDVIAIHQAYLEAGADIINANTFGANRIKYPQGKEHTLRSVIEAAFENAREAKKRSGREDACVALDVGPTGKLLEPLGDLAFEDAVAIFAEIMQIGKECGADLVLIETMSDAYEAKAAVVAAKEQTDLPVFVTMVYNESKKLLTGTSPEAVVSTMEGLGVTALGVNCGMGPAQMREVAKELLENASVPVIVNPNAGLPRRENGKNVYDVTPEAFAEIMSEIAKDGAWIVGGCCGTTPEHIRLTKQACDRVNPLPIQPKKKTVISTHGMAVTLCGEPVAVGTQIDPAVSEDVKEALLDEDFDSILDEATEMEDDGADVIRVCVAMPEADEETLLPETILELQTYMKTPLQICTENPKALDQALRIYNGKAMIHAVNGMQERMDQIFPLAKKYGAVVVAELADENGVVKNEEERTVIAKKICQAAKQSGIAMENLVYDMQPEEDESVFAVLETLCR